MKHVRQPEGSRLCGHACLAIVLGITLAEACKKLGHRRGTYTKELVAALGSRATDQRLVPLRQRSSPRQAILKVRWGKTHRSHFVVKSGSKIYDPMKPGPLEVRLWEEWIAWDGGLITSALGLRP